MRARHSHNHVKSSPLQHYAAQNRAAPTESEARLWAALSCGKLGVAFRRQVVLGNRFIVDFVAPRVRLVVEVDGSYHAQRAAADAPPRQQASPAGLPRAADSGGAGHE